MPTNSFQLSPAGAEARFQLLQWRRRFNPNADDPLFRPVDADDFRTLGDDAHDFSNLRQNGLVRVTFPLPPNIKVIDPATNAPSADTFVDIWRSVPTVNDVALTGPDGINPWLRGPNASGGYQLDARFGTLQEQALAAFTAHAQVGNAPPQGMLDDLASFQRILFTNHRVRALSDAVREGTPLPEADGPLTELEQAGKIVFVRACTQCHGGPGQSTPQAPAVRYHDIATQCPRPVDTVNPARFAFKPCPPQLARNARTYEITLPNSTTMRRTSSDPGRALSPASSAACRPRTTGTSWTCRACAGFARRRRTSTTTARRRSRKWSITTPSSSSGSLCWSGPRGRPSSAPTASTSTGRRRRRSACR